MTNCILPIKRTVQVEVVKILCRRGAVNLPSYRTPQLVMIAVFWSLAYFCALAVQLTLRLRATNMHVTRSLIGQCYDHAGNMNSERAKELQKWQNSMLVCSHSKRKGM